MKNSILITIAVCLLAYSGSFAQNSHFTTGGSVEFEKSVNTYAIIKKMYGSRVDDGFLQQAFEQYKKTQPQFKVLKSTLTFGDNKTLFTPVPPENLPGSFFNVPMADQFSTIYSDITANSSTIQKSVFEQTFLVKDSLRKIKWKITDEIREVAGYTCRRANGLMMDSIYVVAFFANQIPVAGGPESFNGLPGMILEVALPHENIIWRATKVTEAFAAQSSITPPKKGKPVNNKQLYETLKEVFKNRGESAQINMILKSYLM